MDIIFKMLSGNWAGKTSKDIAFFLFDLIQFKSSTLFNFPDIFNGGKDTANISRDSSFNVAELLLVSAYLHFFFPECWAIKKTYLKGNKLLLCHVHAMLKLP